MIRVTAAPEPTSFNANVRVLGNTFLQVNPNPSSKEFGLHSYWKTVTGELFIAYRKTCAYSCSPIWVRTAATVDHYRPKALHPDQAYEWSNYRLSRFKMNSNKGTNPAVLDPFLVEDHWFEVDFPSCLVKPGAGLAPDIHTRVVETIKCLRLNDDDELVDERAERMVELTKGEINFAKLSREYPLLAKEVTRQGLLGNLNSVFKSLPSA